MNEHKSPFSNFNFSFDVDLDFDVQDEMSNMRKKVKTNEEINLCSVNEEYSLIQKAIHIMKKGYEVQKKSVVSHLDVYI